MLRRDLQAAMGLKDDDHFRKGYVLPALEAGIIESGKSRASPFWQYRLSECVSHTPSFRFHRLDLRMM
ncbi:MAG: hypothetical protein JWM99_4923 [Verrucomicrobiales bacterium]|nr:hypothetical protein [Verrucomicrobiales bacterium]